VALLAASAAGGTPVSRHFPLSTVYFNVAVSTDTSRGRIQRSGSVFRQLIERRVWTSRPVRRSRPITVDYSWLIVA